MIINADGKVMLRSDTEANWTSVNPILENGETIIVIVNGKQKLKCGDGINRYNDLPFILGNDDEVKNVSWSEIVGKPKTFAPSEHNHNNLYNTKGEVESKLGEKQDSMNEVTNEEILAIFNS